MRWFTGAAIMVVALVVAGAAWADVIELTNGDKVEGKILEEGTAGVKIQTKFGAIIVPRRSIKRVIKEGPAQQEYREKAMELETHCIMEQMEKAMPLAMYISRE